MHLISRLRPVRPSQDNEEEREPLIVKEYPPLQSLHRPVLSPSQLDVESSPTSGVDDAALSQHYMLVAQGKLSSLTSPARSLGPGDIRLAGKHPVAAGGFADILEATYQGRKVVLKAYRCYRSFDVAQVATRFRNEVQACGLLGHNGAFLVGVYSTEAHPFGLVYEYMGGLDLRQYLRDEPNAERLKLLTETARGLDRMHSLGIVHGNVQTTNILVGEDGVAHIAGLGNAIILPRPIEPLHPAMAGDMLAFGDVAWEVFMGGPAAGITSPRSVIRGPRPPRPVHREISDPIWRVIESCWHDVASMRMLVGEVVDLLEAELRYIGA